MGDVAAVVVLLVIPMVVVITLVARSRQPAADHSIAARRFGIAGAALGLSVAAFWAGLFLGWW